MFDDIVGRLNFEFVILEVEFLHSILTWSLKNQPRITRKTVAINEDFLIPTIPTKVSDLETIFLLISQFRIDLQTFTIIANIKLVVLAKKSSK